MSVADAIAAIRARDPAINAFTAITADRALARERSLDPALPLAGVPFAVKNLFDVEGMPTLAGSKINRDLPAARADAPVIRRLEQAGAILVGTLNMDEYAYGFSTENTHYGPTRNPGNPQHVAGGSSGGSAAAVAAGLVPLALGTDTNGSIRVPASFCGVWGLKPTFGRLDRTGVFPFANSLDHVGPLAATLDVLASAYDAMQDGEPVRTVRGIDGLRIARAVGYFEENAEPEVCALVGAAAEKLGVRRTIEIPEAARARGAAFIITASEGGQLHLPNLRKRPQDFDPMIVDRLVAGALVPAAWYLQAQRVRRWFYRKVMALFEHVDVILAPATPRPAQRIGQEMFSIRGREMPARPSAGLLTQPISCIGLPVVCAPVGKMDGLPVGMQIIAAPWREDHCFRVARAIESS
ncbi:MAG TPA: AtzE family amidohydrolase [Burkholderiales bacterium]|jgi:AtzE family amidohydrolase|nr:AtzE family amidohydrolase [Burkholderiales bacterium]